jgi:hypothetical protein
MVERRDQVLMTFLAFLRLHVRHLGHQVTIHERALLY